MTASAHPAAASAPALAFCFGPFTLVPQRQLLLRGDAPVRLGGRALDILAALVEQPGQLLSKPALIARVWPDTIVDEGSLKVHMVALRRALGDGGDGQAGYIATTPGRGYQFIAPVTTSPCAGFGTASAPARVEDAAPARTHNLPAGTVRIVGRDETIAALGRELVGARLLSIVGPGGVGKTTVAVAVAAQAQGNFADGAWLVDLAPLRDAPLLPGTIATALGVATHCANMLDALCGYLQPRTMLLVLDSCEHLVDAAAACAQRLLAAAPGLRIIVTSRAPLRAKGERIHRLSGLGLPCATLALSAQEALAFPAIELFVARATDRRDSFRLRDAEAPLVADICRRLDGLALAIELAATRIDAFGIAGLRDQLAQRFPLLEGRRAGPERQRTLSATIGWSVDLLSDSERALLRRLAVFAGAFSLASACAINADAGGDAAGVARDLAYLVAKSLLAASVRAGQADYRLLDTTRAFCLEQLRRGGEADIIAQRHAAYVCAVLERAAHEWTQRAAPDWGRDYGPFIDDLRAALAWTAGADAQRSLRIRLTVAATLLWTHFSHMDECRIQVALAVAELEAAGLTGSATEMQLQTALAGATMFTRGLDPQVIAALRLALDIAIRLGDTDHRLRCLRNIGSYEMLAGRHDDGMRTLQHFVDIAAADDCSALPEGETHLALAEMLTGRLQAARQRIERLHTHDLQACDDARFVRFQYARNVDVCNVLSNTQWLTGDCDTALRTAAANVDDARRGAHALSLSHALAFALPVFFCSGRQRETQGYVAQLADQVLRNAGAIWGPLVPFYRGAIASSDDASAADGIDDMVRGIAQMHVIGNMVRMPFYLAVLADAQGRCGRFAEAGASIEDALACARDYNEQWCLPEVLRVQAAVLAARGRTADAAAALVAALASVAQTGGLGWRGRVAADLAALQQTRSRGVDAAFAR